jgi:iron complex outermembrane recepter protein
MGVELLLSFSRPNGRNLLINALLASSALMVAGGTAHGQTGQTRSSERQAIFSIPAGDLNAALLAFGEAAGIKVVFDPAPLQGKRMAGLTGTSGVREGLDRLLGGTGFSYRFTAVDTVTIVPAAAQGPARPSEANAVRLGGVRVTASAIDTEDSYAPAPSSVGTKLELPVRQTPFTINQAIEELIRERGDVNIFETLESFAGVSTVSSNVDIGQGISRSINVRGFDLASSGQQLINGQRSYSLGSQNRNADNLERVELLRGPAALYYGAAQPGGIINYVYKRPKEEAGYQIFAKTDTEGSYGGTIDLTGPLTADGTLLYRAVGNYTRYEDDQDKIFSNPVSALGALTWRPSRQFETNITYEYYDFESIPEQENNKLDGKTGEYFPVPREFFWGSTNDRAQRTSHTVIWDANWKPSEHLKVAAYANYQRADQWYQNTRTVGGGRGGTPTSADPDGNVPRYISLSPNNEYENWSAGLDVSGDFMTGGFRHDWLVGGGLGQTRTRSASMPSDISCLYGQRGPTAACPDARSLAPSDLNIVNPVYEPWAHADLRDEARFMVPWAKRKDYNIYFQDLITLPNETTRLLLAVGWSKFDNLGRGSYNWTTETRGADIRNKKSAWTPRFAVMQDIGESSTVYASYGESFNPQSSPTMADEQGNPLLSPETGKQYEIGYKRDLFGGEGLLQMSVFRIDKGNVARAANAGTCEPDITDPGDPNFCYYMLDGKQRSDGFEVELSGNITSWWSASVGYSYLKAEVKQTNDLPNLGKQLPYIPQHALTLWNRFKLHEWGNGSTVATGVGVKMYDRVHNSYDAAGQTDWNPAYELVNLGLFYTTPVGSSELRINANISNLFDATYYDRRRYYNAGTIVWGNKRRATLTAELTF